MSRLPVVYQMPVRAAPSYRSRRAIPLAIWMDPLVYFALCNAAPIDGQEVGVYVPS